LADDGYPPPYDLKMLFDKPVKIEKESSDNQEVKEFELKCKMKDKDTMHCEADFKIQNE